MFRILVFGDPNTTIPYISNTGVEDGGDQEDYYEAYKEINVMDNVCNLEINVISKLTADLDNIIPNVDGIIYFLNPMDTREYDLFEIVSEIIQAAKRDIPIIIFFYSISEIITIPSNVLLESIWKNFPTYESFINISPHQFYNVYACLSDAMITGKLPINLKNAWMRMPILISQSNNYFKQENYFNAARCAESAAKVANVYGMNDYFIYAEKSAYLYSVAYRYLEASEVIKKVDKKRNKQFKKYYVENMIRYGTKLFNKKNFDEAAKQYETAGNWSSLELEDRNLTLQAYNLSINSWISACKVESAFILSEKMDRDEKRSILKEIYTKIIDAADYLISEKKLPAAKEQLYLSINKYQKEGLFKPLKEIASKLTETLILMFKEQISEKDIYYAKGSYDEIVNIWDTFKIDRVNLDVELEKLIRYFAESLNFNMVVLLINELNSLELKKELTEFSSKIEDSEKEERKKAQEDLLEEGVSSLRAYVKVEKERFLEICQDKIDLANHNVEKQKFNDGAQVLLSHSKLMKAIGEEEMASEIITQAIDIFIKGDNLEDVIQYSGLLKETTRKTYFKRILNRIINSIKSNYYKEGYTKIDKHIESFIKIYRTLMMYEGSKEITELFIDYIKEHALKVIETNLNKTGIKASLELVQKALDISSAYLDSTPLNFDDIYKNIAETYIQLNDLNLANAYNQRIENKEYSLVIHKKIQKITSGRSALKAEKAHEAMKGELLKEKLSILKKKAVEAENEKEEQLKKRKALKRAYFLKAINLISKMDYDNTIQAYKEASIRLGNIKKYNLSGLSIAIACLILIKENQFEKVSKLISELRKELKSHEKILFETFPINIIQYVLEMKKYGDEKRILEAISFMKHLPLFDIENVVLSLYLGEDIAITEPEKKEDRRRIVKEEGAEIPKIRTADTKIRDNLRKEKAESNKKSINLEQNYAKLKQKRVDAKRSTDLLFKNRKAMRRRYYEVAIQLIVNGSFKEASEKYLTIVKMLLNKKDFENASLLLLLWGLSLLKVDQSPSLLKKQLEAHLKPLGISKDLIKETFYVLMLTYLIDSKLADDDTSFKKGKKLLDILPLFEEEKILL